MTLCMAWVRQTEENEELVFATDSCLTGGEKWNTGIKLFELPRKDCVICFKGETRRTYPLILNLISSIKYDKFLSSEKTDIYHVMEHTTRIFTNLCNQITEPASKKGVEDSKSEIEFIFGGWSWEKNALCIWKIFYSKELNRFTHELADNKQARVFLFIGDHIDEANKMLVEELTNSGKILSKNLDMEPLKVLTLMAGERGKFWEIGGNIQLAKIYKSGITEFFGVYHSGKISFLGKEVAKYNKPSVKFIDIETGGIFNEVIPNKIVKIADIMKGHKEKEFVLNCYPCEELRKDLKQVEKEKLFDILQDISYEIFLNVQENKTIEEEVLVKDDE